MKQIIVFAFSLLFMSTCFSCGKVDGNNSDANSTTVTPDSSRSNILIVYFSRAGENYNVGHIRVGNTARMAGFIQEFTGGNTFEIVPTVPYPDGYEAMKKVSEQETAGNARPAIKYPLENLDSYSVVFIGCPIWYGAPPMIMRTFYESYKDKLGGKVIIPFGTHEGSGVSSCTNLVKEYFPNAKLLETLGIRGQEVNNSPEIINEWLRRIGVPKQTQDQGIERQ